MEGGGLHCPVPDLTPYIFISYPMVMMVGFCDLFGEVGGTEGYFPFLFSP